MIEEVRQAIADALINSCDLPTTAYITEQVNTPQAMVAAGDITYDDDMDGTALYEYTIVVYLPRSAEWSQQYFDTLAEPGELSLKAAIEGDVNLKALIEYAVVSRASAVRTENVGEPPNTTSYLVRDFDVKVYA